MSDTPRIILASTSPYRRQLLGKLGLDFETLAPACDETPANDETPARLVERLARAKAASVADTLDEPALVIGSDQVAELDGQLLTKPGEHARAVAQLRASSGRTVVFHTALALLDTRNDEPCRCLERVEYRVHFRSLSDAEIERYLAAEAPYDCAGSIRSEGYAVTLFDAVEGDDPNALIGLPLIRLAAALREAGIALP